jgi:hypothetical protein
MSSQYNDVFERLMARSEASGEPLVGMVAYAIYKQSKAQRCQQATKNGTPLTQQELQTYHHAFNDVMLKALETEAREALFSFAEVVKEQEKPEIIEEAIGELIASLDSKNNDLRHHISESTSFWKGFWPGFASSTAFFIIAGVIAFIYAINNPDTIKSVIGTVDPQAKIEKSH